MKRSYLENLYFKRRTDHSLRNYKKQKNYCSRLYKKERKNCFNKLNTSFVSNNKLFWKTVKPFFSIKEAVSTLDVNENAYIINPGSINISDPIEKALSKYKFHPSILLINDKVVNQDKFSFKPVSKLDIDKEVQLNNPKMRVLVTVFHLQISSEVSADTLHNLFNDILKNGNFPDNLKLVNYRPVSVLPSISSL